MSRFQTTYTRDFGKDRIVPTLNSVFREECHPLHYDSGVASDEDEDDITQNYHGFEAVHKDCLGPCKASSLAYIHHISPKEHNQRHSCKCFDEPKPQLCQRKIPERQQKSHYSLGSSERWYNKLNDHARETQKLINKSEKLRRKTTRLIMEKEAAIKRANDHSEKELEYKLGILKGQRHFLNAERGEHLEIDSKLLTAKEGIKRLLDRLNKSVDSSECLRRTSSAEIQSCWRNEKHIANKNIKKLRSLMLKLENHQSNCCEKMHELLEGDIRRRVLTINRMSGNLPGNHSSSPNENLESDSIIRKSKEVRQVCESLLEESVELGRSVRREVEVAWDQTNLEVENYIRNQSAERGKYGIQKRNKCAGDLDHNLRQLEKTLENITICLGSRPKTS